MTTPIPRNKTLSVSIPERNKSVNFKPGNFSALIYRKSILSPTKTQQKLHSKDYKQYFNDSKKRSTFSIIEEPNSPFQRLKNFFNLKKKNKIKNENTQKNTKKNNYHHNLMNNFKNYTEQIIANYKNKYESTYKKYSSAITPQYFIDVIEKDDLEKLLQWQDNYPLLVFRKKLFYFQKTISFVCQKIEKNTFFQIFTFFLIWIFSFLIYLNKIQIIQNRYFTVLYDVILVSFVIEIIIKIIANGFFARQKAFFRSFLNFIDFFIVLLAFLVNFLINFDNSNIRFLGSLVILRPFTSAFNLKRFKLIKEAISSAIPLLKESFVILMFFYLFFALNGLHLFKGYLKKRCFSEINGMIYESLVLDDVLCHGNEDCEEDYICGKMISSINYDYTTFDTFYSSFLNVFLLNLLQSWNETMIQIQLTFSPFTAFYFVILTLFGFMILLNLNLAILKVRFSEFKAKEDKLLKNDEEKLYSLEKLKKLKIYLGNKTKQKELFKKGQKTLSKIKNLIVINNITNKYSDKKIFSRKFSMKKKPKSPSKISNSPRNQNKIYPIEMSKENEKKNEKKIIDLTKIKNLLKEKIIMNKEKKNNNRLKLLPIKINSRITSNKTTEIFETNENVFEEFMNKEDNFTSVRKLTFEKENDIPLSVILDKTKNKDTLNEKQLSFSQQEITNIINNEEKINSAKNKSKLVKTSSKENRFSRIHHGISYLAEKKNENSERIETNVPLLETETEKENEKIDNQFENEIDFEDPEIEILKKLNPKMLKLQPNHNKIYNETSTDDVLITKPKRIQIQKIKKSHRNFTNLIFSKNFYAESLKETQSHMTKKNFTNILFDRKTMKKINALKLPLTFTNRLKSLKKNFLIINNEKNNYFFMIQNRIKRPKNSRRFTIKKEKEKRKTHIDNNIDLNDIEKVKELFFNNEKIIINSSSDEEEKTIQNVLKEIHEEIENKQWKIKEGDSENHIEKLLAFQSENKKQEDLRKENIIKKLKILHEFNFTQSIDEIFKKDQEIFEKSKKYKIMVNWSGEDVFDYNKYYYSYNPTRIAHALKRMKTIVKSLNYTKFNYDIYEMHLQGRINEIRKKFRILTSSNEFNTIMLIFIIINTIVLSLNGLLEYDQDLLNLNLAFIIIFTCETGFKLIGLGFKKYSRNFFNILDLLIVTISLIELSLTNETSSLSSLRAIKSIRVFRMSRLLNNINYAKTLVNKIKDALKNCIDIGILLLIFLYVFGLLGMNLYEGKLYYTGIRQNFNTLFDSIVAVFQIVTLANWQLILIACFRTDISEIISIGFFVCCIVIGNFTLLNLFLAILLDVFANEDSKNENNVYGDDDFGEDLEEIKQLKILEKITSLENDKDFKKDKNIDSLVNKFSDKSWHSFKFESQFARRLLKKAGKENISQEKNLRLKDNKCEKSFYFFGKDNIFRIWCFKIIKSKEFNLLMSFTIFLSFIQLILYTYSLDYKNDETIVEFTFYFDLAIFIVFFFEVLVKSIAQGFCLDEDSYLMNKWNQINFLTLIFSMIIIATNNTKLENTLIIMLLNSFKIIRFISYSKIKKLIVGSLFHSLKGILKIVFVVLLIWLIFSILGVNFLQSKLGYCSSPEIHNPYGIDKIMCERVYRGEWKVFQSNFENAFNGMLTLFILSSFEGFPHLIFRLMDGSDDLGPIKENTYYVYIYFLIYIIISSIFLMNLFVCTIFLNFIIAEKNAKSKLLNKDQYHWIELQKLIILENPDYTYMIKPEKGFRLFFYNLTRSSYFENFISICIIINVIIMSLNYEGSPSEYEKNLSYINLFFTFLFTVELILKFIGMGFKSYFYSGWNKLDFITIIISDFDIILELFHDDIKFSLNEELYRALKSLKFFRILRLIKRNNGLQKMLLTLIYSLPQFINFFTLFSIFYLVFAYISVILFHNIKKGEKLDEKWNNFTTIWKAILTLIRFLAGEDWQYIMYDTMDPEVECYNGHHCGNSKFKSLNILNLLEYFVIFFIAFMFFIKMIIFNIFILIVLQQYEENYISSDNPLQNYHNDIYIFKQNWIKNTEKYEGTKIHEKELINFFINMPSPLGFDKFGDKKIINFSLENEQIRRLKTKMKKEAAIAIMNMNLFCDSCGFLYFNEILFATMKRLYCDNKIKQATQFGVALIKKEEEKNMQKIEKMKHIVNNQESLKEHRSLKKGTSLLLSEKKTPINPLIGLLFAGMGFKAWMNYSKLNKLAENQLDSEDSGSYTSSYEEIWDEDEFSLDSSENSQQDSS